MRFHAGEPASSLQVTHYYMHREDALVCLVCPHPFHRRRNQTLDLSHHKRELLWDVSNYRFGVYKSFGDVVQRRQYNISSEKSLGEQHSSVRAIQ